MKRIASAVICFALMSAAGCADAKNTLVQSVQDSLSHVLSQTAAKANHSKEYYSYYLSTLNYLMNNFVYLHLYDEQF